MPGNTHLKWARTNLQPQAAPCGKHLSEIEPIMEAVPTYMQCAAEKLRAQHSLCKKTRTGMFNPKEAHYAKMVHWWNYLWRAHPDPELRQLMLEVQRCRCVIDDIDKLNVTIHQAWRDAVVGYLIALHLLKQTFLYQERYRLLQGQ